MNKTDILSLSQTELTQFIKSIGESGFRANQIFLWLHQKQVQSFDEMTNLSKSLRDKLNDVAVINTVKIEKKLVSKIDGTIKYLFKLNDGEFIESVLMKYKYGYSVCVSSQVGCRMGCKFCASTLNGIVRCLLPSEILSQIYVIQKDNRIRVSHTVLMGMGEPLDNFENVNKFLLLVTDDKGQNMSMRHISLSTCGVVPKIYELADKDYQLTLSVSLHAPFDDIRSSMMPVNRKYSIEELLKGVRYYVNKTNRRISFEYAMVKGKNDTAECADKLAEILKGMLCHINLIPVNEVTETGIKRSDNTSIYSFKSRLESKGYTVTIRRELGSDINASCGQLRRNTINGEKRG